jgi:hypothetical protein
MLLRNERPYQSIESIRLSNVSDAWFDYDYGYSSHGDLSGGHAALQHVDCSDGSGSGYTTGNG